VFAVVFSIQKLQELTGNSPVLPILFFVQSPDACDIASPALLQQSKFLGVFGALSILHTVFYSKK